MLITCNFYVHFRLFSNLIGTAPGRRGDWAETELKNEKWKKNSKTSQRIKPANCGKHYFQVKYVASTAAGLLLFVMSKFDLFFRVIDELFVFHSLRNYVSPTLGSDANIFSNTPV